MLRHAAAVLLILCAGISVGAEDAPRFFQQLEAGQVALYRDEWGMPHVYAAAEEDGYFGLGYATAQDRLVQVLFFYLRMRGELAKHFGREPIRTLPGVYQPEFELPGGPQLISENPLGSDRNVLQARYLLDARANFAKLPQQVQQNMRSFIAGLQRYMDSHPQAVPPWAPKLEPALPLALYAATSFPTTAQTYRRMPQPCAAVVRKDSRTASTDRAMQPIMGSNIWALAGSRAVDAGAVFGGDSHGDIFLGSGPTFYLWQLHTPQLDVFSIEVAGTAAMLNGHSRHFAWGWAEATRRTADCYAVETLESQPRRYRYDAEQRSMEVVPYRIEIKGEKPERGAFEYTHHNGVRSPVVQRSGRIAYVVSNAYMGRAGYLHEQMHNLATARDAAGLRTALEQRDWYAGNVIIAGADGTLLYARPGRVPRRAPGVNPAEILDGNTSQTAWQGLHSFADAVQIWNPPQGFIANANTSPDKMYREPLLLADKYPAYFEFEPGETSARHRRIMEVLERADGFSDADAQALTVDVQVLDVVKWGPAIAAALAVAGDSADTGADPDRQRFLRELTRFDGKFEAKSAGALFHYWLRLTLFREDAVTVDTLGDAIDTGRALTEAQQQQLLQVVDATYARLKANPDCDYFNKTFGDVYRIGRGGQDYPASGVSFGARKQPLRAGAPPFSVSYEVKIANRCQRLAFTGPRSAFTVMLGAKVRSYSLAVWGASEDPKSPHFNDQSRLASERRLRSNWFEPQELAAHITSSQLLSARSAEPR